MKMEDYRVVHNQSEEDAIDVRESFDKILMGDKVVIALTHGSSGGTDSFPAWVNNVASINAVSDNEDMTSPYTSATDYTAYVANDDEIDWSPGGSEPAVGAVYYVSINWTKTYQVDATDKVDGNTQVITVGGFNPETDLRGEPSKYPKGGDTRVKQDLAKSTKLSQLIFYPIRNTASPFGNMGIYHQENESNLEFKWNSFIHSIVGVGTTGTSTNYCNMTLNEDVDGTFDYMDDYAEATKWTYDRHYQSGVTHSGSQLNFGASSVLIYKFSLPFMVKTFEVTTTFGTSGFITYMTEADYSETYDGVGNVTSGTTFDVYERVFYIKISINSSYLSDIRFEADLRSAGCTHSLQIGTNTFEFTVPTNARVNVSFVHKERSLRLEEESNVKATPRLAMWLRGVEESFRDHNHAGPSSMMYADIAVPDIENDGYTNTAILNAIARLVEDSELGGGTVLIPPGTYSGSIGTISDDNIFLVGCGKTTIISGVTLTGENCGLHRLYHSGAVTINGINNEMVSCYNTESYSSWGIAVNGTQCRVLNNRIEEVTFANACLYVNGVDNVITGNSIEMNGTTNPTVVPQAIRVDAGADWCIISNNRIIGRTVSYPTDGAAVFVYTGATYNSICGNIISSYSHSGANIGYGLWFWTNANENIWIGNQIYNCETAVLDSGTGNIGGASLNNY